MTTVDVAPQRNDRQPSVAFPLILISLGALFLLANLGLLAGVRWGDLFRLWPVLLVIAGVDIVLRRRSWILAAIADVAIIGAAVIYVVTGPTTVAAPLSFASDVPRSDASELAVSVNYGGGAVRLAGGAGELVSVRSSQQDVVQRVTRSGASAQVVISSESNGRITWDGRDRAWTVQIPSDMPTALTLNAGAGSYDMDLSQVQLTRATLNGGAASYVVALPQPRGDVPIHVSVGMSSLDLVIPPGVAYRIRHSGFAQSFSGAASSGDYASASDRFTIELTGAMTSVTIR